VNNLPFELAGLAGARRVNPLKVIQSHTSVTKRERRRAYHRKHSARLQSSQFKCGSPAVEPRSITLPSSAFSDYESASSDSDLTDNILLNFCKEGGVTALNDSIHFVTATCIKSPSSFRSDSRNLRILFLILSYYLNFHILILIVMPIPILTIFLLLRK